MAVKRLLCIVGSMNAGGAETFLMKLYRNLDKKKYQMDFAVAVQEKGYYDDEIIAMGGKIFHITPKSQGFFKNFSSMVRLVRNEKYKYVLRTSQHSLSALELFAAQLGGAKVRIFRSSNSNTTTGRGKDLMLHKICRFMPRVFANVKIAPSTAAAEFMYGKNCIERKKAFLVHNAIDLNVYKYNSENVDKIRREFNLEDKFVVGHVGRFNQQKNHKFLLEIFKKIKEKNNNAVLMLVGTGELKNQIDDKIEEMGISDSVIFTGVRSDVPDLLSAMDVFVFPSLYEGMPNVVIEAQATGLPCIIADTITKEADITGLVNYMSLQTSAKEWAEKVGKSINTERVDTKENFIKNGYDIRGVTGEFVKLVFGE